MNKEHESGSNARAVVRGGGSFNGELEPPGDKSISHRALIFASFCKGRSTLSGVSLGADVSANVNTLLKLGVDVHRDPVDPTRITVVSDGPSSYGEPSEILDVGNSGTLLRLMTGVLVGCEGHFVLTGDRSIVQRPMMRVVSPLRQLGAKVDGRDGGAYAPISIRGSSLKGRELSTQVPSAQVKSSLILAGLMAEGTTKIHELIKTRAHTEEFLSYLEIDHEIVDYDSGARDVTVNKLTRAPRAFTLGIPADPSQAAFFIAGALISSDSDLVLRGIYLGEGRDAYLKVLERMGAHLSYENLRDGAFPIGDVGARSSLLKGTEISSAEVPGLIDEIPILAAIATFAEGVTTFYGVSELRAKESDRIATTIEMIKRFGGRAESDGERLSVFGQRNFKPKACVVDSYGDHRIAMSSAIMATQADGDTEILDFGCVETSYVDFAEHLSQMRSGEIFIA
jgi:3-phosphoshikimate 1-carboxyvinyltransferase